MTYMRPHANAYMRTHARTLHAQAQYTHALSYTHDRTNTGTETHTHRHTHVHVCMFANLGFIDLASATSRMFKQIIWIQIWALLNYIVF